MKIIRPDLTTNDFGRILPRKMYKDKERLYSEGLQLKQAINEISEENVRLKTQVSVLEREKYRDRFTESGDVKNKNKKKELTHSKLFERDSKTVNNLKRLLRQYK